MMYGSKEGQTYGPACDSVFTSSPGAASSLMPTLVDAAKGFTRSFLADLAEQGQVAGDVHQEHTGDEAIVPRTAGAGNFALCAESG
jgi:hypothetical protein